MSRRLLRSRARAAFKLDMCLVLGGCSAVTLVLVCAHGRTKSLPLLRVCLVMEKAGELERRWQELEFKQVGSRLKKWKVWGMGSGAPKRERLGLGCGDQSTVRRDPSQSGPRTIL